jgi:hypothetical protein
VTKYNLDNVIDLIKNKTMCVASENSALVIGWNHSGALGITSIPSSGSQAAAETPAQPPGGTPPSGSPAQR